MPKGVVLERMTWKEAEDVLRSGRVAVLPLGARLKEHGLHLPLNNDWLTAEYLGRRVVEGANVILLPTLPYGYYPAFVEYPGSVTTTKETCRDLVVQIGRSLARHGLRKLYVLNTGISTNWALEPARQELATGEHPLIMEYTDLHTVNRTVKDQVRTQSEGTHADELETSMMMYLAPEVVKLDRATPDIHPETAKGPLRRYAGEPTGRYSPTGAFGDPTRATREKGEKLIEGLVGELLAFLRTFAADSFAPAPPRPLYSTP